MEGNMIKGLFYGVRVVFFLSMAFIFTPMMGHAQDEVSKFPTRPVTYIHPYAAGTSADLSIRLISKEAEKFLGQPIIVVNKPGGGGAIGVAAVATALPDGYTIGNANTNPMLIIPHLEKLPYHPVRDFKMIMQFGSLNLGVIVKSDAPFKSFKDLITFARQNPKKLTYGTTGVTSTPSIVLEQIARREKVQLTHIPFKATSESQTALLGGHILFAAGDFNYSLVEAGQIRLLLLLREERAAEYPETPIVKDMGYDFPIPTFICAAGPKGLPDGIVKKLEDAFTKAMKEPAFAKGMKDLRLPIVYRNSRDLNAYVTHNYETYGRMLKDLGLMK